MIAVANLWIQDGVGIAIANLLGANPATGLLAGSLGLSGGHGTAIAWAATLKSTFDLPNAMEIGTAAATFGLVVGGVLGGPLGRFLIRRHQLHPRQPGARASGSSMRRRRNSSSTSTGCCRRCWSSPSQSGSARELNRPRRRMGVQAARIRHCTDRRHRARQRRAAALSPPAVADGDTSAGVRGGSCARTVSRDEPHEPAALDAPRGRGAAVRDPRRPDCGLLDIAGVGGVPAASEAPTTPPISTSGYFGLSMGATPTAIAVMTAITKAHGASPRSFIVVPLVGAFFVDIANAITDPDDHSVDGPSPGRALVERLRRRDVAPERIAGWCRGRPTRKSGAAPAAQHALAQHS